MRATGLRRLPAMFSRGPRRGRDAPLLSVVVPAYDVEDYLADCLQSILNQSHADLEVVVVDDGSTDSTGRIADQVASEDPRVQVVHQANAGLGAARNEGARRCTGTYLAFADSDDLVVDGAYAALVGSLERTGSDISIGAVQRLRGDQTYMTPLMRENHQHQRLAVSVDQVPLVLADVFAWNKVFRRSFWDRAGLAFPEEVRYEDQPAMTRALVAADRIDLLADPVYLWRVRSDGSSISQQRDDLRDLTDRLATKRWSTRTVCEHTAESTQEVWFARVLPIDMWEYFRAVPGCSDDYWQLLRAGTNEFWNADTVPFERTSLPLRQRLMGWLVCQGRREDLSVMIDFIDRHPEGLPRRLVGNREVVDHPFVDLPGLPPELLAP